MSAGVDIATSASGAAVGAAAGITTAILRETTRAVAGDVAATAVSSALNTGVFVAGTAAHTTARVAGAAAGAVTALAVTGVGNAMVRVAMGPDERQTPPSTQEAPQTGQGDRWGAASTLWDDIPPSDSSAPPRHSQQAQGSPTVSRQSRGSSPDGTAAEGHTDGGSGGHTAQHQLYPAVPDSAADAECASPCSASAKGGTCSPSGSASSRLVEVEEGYVWVPSPSAAGKAQHKRANQ